MQVELAAILKSSQTKTACSANSYVSYTSLNHKKIITKSNIMKPVVAGEIDPLLTSLPKIKVLETLQPNADLVRQWLANWQKAVSK